MKFHKTMPVFLVLAVVFVSGCTQYGGQPAPTTTQPPATGGTTNGGDATGQVTEIDMTAKRWEFIPETVTVSEGDTVRLHVTSVDVTHGFGLPDFGINERLEPGRTADIEFVADKKGTFSFLCTVFCGSGHSGMTGQLVVQ